jgi:hypothetical protein
LTLLCFSLAQQRRRNRRALCAGLFAQRLRLPPSPSNVVPQTKEISDEYCGQSYRWQAEALMALQEAAEVRRTPRAGPPASLALAPPHILGRADAGVHGASVRGRLSLFHTRKTGHAVCQGHPAGAPDPGLERGIILGAPASAIPVVSPSYDHHRSSPVCVSTNVPADMLCSPVPLSPRAPQPHE